MSDGRENAAILSALLDHRMKQSKASRTTWGEHLYSIRATGDSGFSSGRDRYWVACKTCNEVVHENTTGPMLNIQRHEREYEREKERRAANMALAVKVYPDHHGRCVACSGEFCRKHGVGQCGCNVTDRHQCNTGMTL